jgi:hypothetical protein
MLKTVVVTALVLVPLVGCKKSESTSSKGAAPAAQPAPTTPPASAAPVAKQAEYKPDELWKALAGLSRIEMMDKFGDGVAVAGTVSKITDDPTGEYVVELEAGDGHTIALGFADFGKAAKAKGLKTGDAVAATKCQVTNPTADREALTLCDLK